MEKKIINSCGVVLVRYENNELLFLLLRAYKYWDFPKGQVDNNDSFIETAIREVKEECSIDDLNFNFGYDYYSTQPYSSPKKIANYFLALTEQKNVIFQINPELGKAEHDEFRWCNKETALSLTNDRIKAVINWADDKIKFNNKLKI